MLKLLGSYALARLLGGGLVLALVIYLILTMLGREETARRRRRTIAAVRDARSIATRRSPYAKMRHDRRV